MILTSLTIACSLVTIALTIYTGYTSRQTEKINRWTAQMWDAIERSRRESDPNRALQILDSVGPQPGRRHEGRNS